ncbi:pre-mRNA-splicing factor 38B isoform X1 [Toxorhynchites rutilus septentrionalis]|uniref:pre-mRNA-splicing factor 38B isoform X1 n=1 Tax=Toxorhynchites rutilus septentrionalis TaxID=329112 RepID=UPI00247A655B|nr:pre-mRNA-splicing factor 38B isoform X1 [Toxorhynchites rutilus septentrionalis]
MESEYYDDQQQQPPKKSAKQNNALPLWGNESTMNLNALILANIQGSSYFKVSLFKLKTYHEVVDEIYYQVKHLEPWERGSRKTSGQTGMCGGVRGVGAGGIVSTAFCLLYKLYTLRLTRKQVNGLLTHGDSPYIRALGFMYLRFTQPPADLYDWYEPYLLDEEEIDVKAGGGQTMTIGQMVRQYLTKLDWFSTLFPRIPVPIQKQIESKLEQFARENNVSFAEATNDRYSKSGGRNYERPGNPTRDEYPAGEPSRSTKRAEYAGHCDRDREPPRTARYGRDDDHRRERGRERDYERERERIRVDRDRTERDRDYDRGRDRHRDKRSRSRDRDYQRDRNYERDRKYR